MQHNVGSDGGSGDDIEWADLREIGDRGAHPTERQDGPVYA